MSEIQELRAEVERLKEALAKAQTPTDFWDEGGEPILTGDEWSAVMEMCEYVDDGGILSLQPYREFPVRFYTRVPVVAVDGEGLPPSAMLRVDWGRLYELANVSKSTWGSSLGRAMRLRLIPRNVAQAALDAADEDIFAKIPPVRVRERARLWLENMEEGGTGAQP